MSIIIDLTGRASTIEHATEAELKNDLRLHHLNAFLELMNLGLSTDVSSSVPKLDRLFDEAWATFGSRSKSLLKKQAVPFVLEVNLTVNDSDDGKKIKATFAVKPHDKL